MVQHSLSMDEPCINKKTMESTSPKYLELGLWVINSKRMFKAGGGNLFLLQNLGYGGNNLRVPSPFWTINSIISQYFLDGQYNPYFLGHFVMTSLFSHFSWRSSWPIEKNPHWSDKLIFKGFLTYLGWPNCNTLGSWEWNIS